MYFIIGSTWSDTEESIFSEEKEEDMETTQENKDMGDKEDKTTQTEDIWIKKEKTTQTEDMGKTQEKTTQTVYTKWTPRVEIKGKKKSEDRREQKEKRRG